MTIESRLAQAYRDMAAGDVDRLLALYLPDAIIQSPQQAPVVGRAAIRAFWAATFDRYRVELVPEVQEVTTFGDVIVVRGKATGAFSPTDGGAALAVDTWFMQIYRRQPDGALLFWRGANGPNP